MNAWVGEDLDVDVNLCLGMRIRGGCKREVTLSTISRSWISEHTETRFPRRWLMAFPGR